MKIYGTRNGRPRPQSGGLPARATSSEATSEARDPGSSAFQRIAEFKTELEQIVSQHPHIGQHLLGMPEFTTFKRLVAAAHNPNRQVSLQQQDVDCVKQVMQTARQLAGNPVKRKKLNTDWQLGMRAVVQVVHTNSAQRNRELKAGILQYKQRLLTNSPP